VSITTLAKILFIVVRLAPAHQRIALRKSTMFHRDVQAV
jgi:hypothetical protein